VCYILPNLVATLALLSGCNVYDNNEGCPQGLNVSVYSKNPCENERAYPDNIRNIRYYVFNDRGILAGYQENGNLRLSNDYYQTLATGSGTFSVAAWAGVTTTHYDVNTPQNNVTRKSDLAFRLKREANKATSIDGYRLYYGESASVHIENPKDIGSIFKDIAINMQEVTSRITVMVAGLSDANSYEVLVESGSGSMNINGSVAGDEAISYTPSSSSVTNGALEVAYTLLGLQSGHNSTIIIRSKVNGQEVYKGDLLEALLLKNPSINLHCDHDFTILFNVEDQCTSCETYAIIQIWVNDWLVHSYETGPIKI
jgi:hypothetical protein